MTELAQCIDDVIDWAAGETIWLAYSGGVDSHALLHLLATSPRLDSNTIHAIHINHKLNPDSERWSQHCHTVCNQLGIKFTCVEVDVTNIDDLGMEAAARQARYQAIKSLVPDCALVLTAQHQTDQAETVLLQLMRGAGTKGLSAMAKLSDFGNARLARPLLTVSQQAIMAYAKTHQLNWVEDPSNSDARWSRNFVRHALWPVISERWPSAALTLSRTAQHNAEASELLDELAVLDLEKLVAAQNVLHVAAFLSLSPARRRNALRYFIRSLDMSLPSSKVLQEIIDNVCLSKQDATAIVEWGTYSAQRYQNKLYINERSSDFDLSQEQNINQITPLDLGNGIQLHWRETSGNGISLDLIESGVLIKFRQGGEKIRLQSTHTSQLKSLLQAWGVPPWLRANIPLIYHNDVLIAVGDYGVASDYCVSEREIGYVPYIKRM